VKSTDSVFNVLVEEGLTTLEIFYNRQQDTFTLRGMKEWEESIKWDKYMVEFTHEDILTDDYRSVGTKSLLKVFSSLDLEDCLGKIENLLRDGKYRVPVE
jgi:hypothetical protein